MQVPNRIGEKHNKYFNKLQLRRARKQIAKDFLRADQSTDKAGDQQHGVGQVLQPKTSKANKKSRGERRKERKERKAREEDEQATGAPKAPFKLPSGRITRSMRTRSMS